METTESENLKRQRKIYRVTLIGSLGNFALLMFKFVAGIIGRSDAMIADAIHSLSDFVTDIIVLVFVKISNKPQDKDHAFGHGKYETLATAIIGIVLVLVGLGILFNSLDAIWRWAHGEPLAQPGILALIAALVSIVVKEGLYRYTAKIGKIVNSSVMIANAWHHRSDAFSSIAAAIGIGGAILLGEKWRVLDPIAAALVSILIMKAAFSLIKPSIDELMERSLPEETEKSITKTLTDTLANCDPHNLRTRKIGNRNAMDVHVRMDGNMSVKDSHEITREMEGRLRNLLGKDAFISIHVEPKK